LLPNTYTDFSDIFGGLFEVAGEGVFEEFFVDLLLKGVEDVGEFVGALIPGAGGGSAAAPFDAVMDVKL